MEENKKNGMPIWEKVTLSIEEASAYSNIGKDKLRTMTNDKNCPFVLWNGSKKLIKRRAFVRYLEDSTSI